MAVESAADRAAFFDVDDFGVAGNYNSGTTVNGIFDNEYYGAAEGGEVSLESSNPAFLCRSADVPSAAHSDTLVGNSASYVVIGVQPDGTGMTALILEAQ